MYKIQTQVSFEAAHRLYNVNTYSEECRKNIHGHSYKVTVVVCRPELNDAGMVMDFKKLKKIIKDEIEDVYDHGCVLKYDDPLVEAVSKNCSKLVVSNVSPTAEWMSQQFYKQLFDALKKEDAALAVEYVAVQETEHNIAIYEPEV